MASKESETTTDDEQFCPLIRDTEGKPHPCIKEWCGFYHQASDQKYSRCAIAELSRNLNRMCFSVDALAGDGGGGSSGGKKKSDKPGF